MKELTAGTVGGGKLREWIYSMIKELKGEVNKSSVLWLNDVPKDALWTTRCSRRKSHLKFGTQKEIYISPQNQVFYKWAEKRGIRYGTISDFYGLVMDDQVIKTYDLAPQLLLSRAKRVLGESVGTKCKELGYKSLVLYCKDYIEAKPYLEILSYSGLRVYWLKELPE